MISRQDVLRVVIDAHNARLAKCLTVYSDAHHSSLELMTMPTSPRLEQPPPPPPSSGGGEAAVLPPLVVPDGAATLPPSTNSYNNNKLEAEKFSANIVAITGSSGVGKSTVVHQICAWMAGEHTATVFSTPAKEYENNGMLFAWENVFSKLLFAFTGTLLEDASSPNHQNQNSMSPRKVHHAAAAAAGKHDIDATLGRFPGNNNVKYVDVADPALCVDVSPLVKVGVGGGEREREYGNGNMGMGTGMGIWERERE
jgi:hypothetical protein